MKEQVFINGKPAGWIMPQVSDSRQQPKSLAFKMLEERNAKKQALKELEQFCGDNDIPVVETYRPSTVACSNWDAWTPRYVHCLKTGNCIGTLIPRATQAELGYGIQGWSRPETDTRDEPIFNDITGELVTRGDL